MSNYKTITAIGLVVYFISLTFPNYSCGKVLLSTLLKTIVYRTYNSWTLNPSPVRFCFSQDFKIFLLSWNYFNLFFYTEVFLIKSIKCHKNWFGFSSTSVKCWYSKLILSSSVLKQPSLSTLSSTVLMLTSFDNSEQLFKSRVEQEPTKHSMKWSLKLKLVEFITFFSWKFRKIFFVILLDPRSVKFMRY